MKKLLVSIALASATVTVAAVPASAQNYGWNQRGPSRQAVNELRRDLNQVERQIERSAQRRIISGREAVSLRRDANRIRVRIDRASRGGISGREFAELRGQVNRLEQRLRVERRDRDGRRW